MCTKTYNFYEIPTISRARLRSEEPMEASDILNAIHARLAEKWPDRTIYCAAKPYDLF